MVQIKPEIPAWRENKGLAPAPSVKPHMLLEVMFKDGSTQLEKIGIPPSYDWGITDPDGDLGPFMITHWRYVLLVEAAEPSALDTQVGGHHYKDCKIQPVEFIEANDIKFLEGCSIKRLARHDKPTGKGREDIEKVIHECQLLLELRYSK